MNKEVSDYISNASAGQKEIMETILKLIHESVPGVIEEFKWSRPVFSAKKGFAYLKTAKAHVTLGFYNVQKLKDPDKRLEGTGKDLGHIKLKTMGDIDPKLFSEWFKKAAE